MELVMHSKLRAAAPRFPKILEFWEGGTITWYSPSNLTSAGSMLMLH